MPFASRVFLRHLVGELGTPNLRKFSPVGDVYMYRMLYYTVPPISAKDVSKCVITHKDVPLECERFP